MNQSKIQIGCDMFTDLPVCAYISDEKYVNKFKEIIVKGLMPLMHFKVPIQYTPENIFNAMAIFQISTMSKIENGEGWAVADCGGASFIRVTDINGEPKSSVINMENSPFNKQFQQMFAAVKEGSTLIQYGKDLQETVKKDFWVVFNKNFSKFKWMVERYSISSLITIEASIANQNKSLLLKTLKNIWWMDLPLEEVSLALCPKGYKEFSEMITGEWL